MEEQWGVRERARGHGEFHRGWDFSRTTGGDWPMATAAYYKGNNDRTSEKRGMNSRDWLGLVGAGKGKGKEAARRCLPRPGGLY